MTPLCVDIREAARVLGVSPWVVRRFIADGLLAKVTFPSVKNAGDDMRRVLIAVADLEAFVSRHREVVR